MRLLHTSDWHLGHSFFQLGLAEEHDRFLSFLHDLLREERVDALIVAGDVFDQLHPPAEALQRFYRFLARVGESGVAQVVLVGGNHDSPSRLDAPAEVLETLNIRVVGGLDPGTAEGRARALVPLYRRDGELGAVCLAVPYVHEYRLGVRLIDDEPTRAREACNDAFARLYRQLADEAEARFPGVPLVATGHLALGPASRDDYPQAIHQVGGLESLDERIVDPRIRYLALGHIHRSYPVAGRRGWYSGTPVPTSLAESKPPRQVLLVDLAAEGLPQVQPRPVPAARALLALEGSLDALRRQLRDLSWTEPLPPALFLKVHQQPGDADPGPALRQLLEGLPEPRPALADWRSVFPEADLPPAESRSLDQLEPLDVLELMASFQRRTLDAAQREAFRQVLQTPAEAWATLLAEQAGEAR